MHSEQARLNALVGSIDRKLEEAMKKVKEIHEDTIAENQRSHSQLMEHLEPIRKSLEEKVDQATFSAMIKKFMEEN